MAKYSKAQYELLTDAMAHGLADVKRRDSLIMTNAAMTVINKVADYLVKDNQNFNRKQFMEGIANRSAQSLLEKEGINL